MVYLIILAGFLFLLYNISKFMAQSQSLRAKKFFRYGGALVLGALAFFFLALAKNIPIGGLLAILSFLSAQGGLWKILVKGNPASLATAHSLPPMTRKEAMEILGLSGNPDPDEIRQAHHKIMLKLHPDQGGSDYFARKLNQARDILL